MQFYVLLAGVETFSRSQGDAAAAQGALKAGHFVQWRARVFAVSGTKLDIVGFRRDYFGDGGGGIQATSEDIAARGAQAWAGSGQVYDMVSANAFDLARG